VLQTGSTTQLEIPSPSIRDASVEEIFRPIDVTPPSVELLRKLWEGRKVLARAMTIGFAAGLLIAFLIPSRYKSTARLMPPDSQSQASASLGMLAALTSRSGSGAMGGIAGDLLGIRGSGALFTGILRSRTVEDRLIKRFDLHKVYGISLEEDTRARLLENTEIAEDRKSGIISITVTDHDPRRAAAIAQAYVDELNQLVAELSTSAAHRERAFLEGRLGSVKKDLDDASQKFSQFESSNKTIDIKEQARAIVQGAATIEGELVATESELKGLEEIYTENNVRVRAVQARIAELRRQLDKLDGPTPKDTQQTAEVSDTAYPTIRKLPLLGVTYADLYRRVQIQEAVYETLTQQFELAKVQEAKETPSVKILDAASLPERKSFPPRTLIAFLGAFVAVTGVVVSTVARANWEQIDARDPGKLFAQEVFKTVHARMPWAESNGSRVQAATHKVWLRLIRREETGKSSLFSEN
jgi:capsule polysaccharide export protein KpsE/RkpR